MYQEPYSEIINGKPIEHSYTGDTFTQLVTDLPKEKQDIVFDWINRWMHPRKTPNTHYTSYGLKHMLERDTSIYLYNNQFKHAMLLMGFEPVDSTALNWVFRISEKPLTEWKRKWMNKNI